MKVRYFADTDTLLSNFAMFPLRRLAISTKTPSSTSTLRAISAPSLLSTPPRGPARPISRTRKLPPNQTFERARAGNFHGPRSQVDDGDQSASLGGNATPRRFNSDVRLHMRRLFFHDPREFNELADLVVSVALPGFTKSLHVGLNLWWRRLLQVRIRRK